MKLLTLYLLNANKMGALINLWRLFWRKFLNSLKEMSLKYYLKVNSKYNENNDIGGSHHKELMKYQKISNNKSMIRSHS